MLDKLKNIFYKIILIILAVFVAYVCYCSVFKIYGTQEELKPIIIIIGTIFMIIGLVSVKRIIDKVDEKKVNIIAIILTILFFILMSVFGNIYKSEPTYDLSDVIREANAMLENNGQFQDEFGYFKSCTNQIPLAIMVYLIFKLGSILGFGGNSLMGFATVINSLFIAITAFFTYLSVKKMKDCKAGLITLLFFVLNPIFYLFSSYFYTDTMCMPFAAIGMYLLICSIQNQEIKKKIIYSVLSGLVLAIGFKIRVVIGILIIGFIIAQFLNKDSIKNKVIPIFAIIIGFIIGVISFTIFSELFGIIEDKNEELPVTHYLMYGVNLEKDGKWNAEDYNYTTSNETHDEKVEANIKKIKERLKDLKLSGLYDLILQKLAVNWSNGDYDITAKLNFVVEDKATGYEFIEGNKNIFLKYYLQICKLTVMLLFFVAILTEFKSSGNFKYIYISIFGMFAFYLLWEVLSRYSLTCLPWIILLIYIGLEKIQKIIEVKKVKLIFYNNKEKTINTSKVMKNVLIILTVLSALLLIINFDKYCIQKDVYYDKVTMLRKGNSEGIIEDIYNKKIEQTFVANKKFNSITLNFNKDNANTTNNKYYFVLLDEQENELVRQEFYSKDIKDGLNKKFKFDYIKPNGKQKYKILIYTEDNLEDSINLAGYSGGNSYNVYPTGDIKINGEDVKNLDLLLKVENQNKRTYMNWKQYIIISIMILIIEFLIYYLYNRKDTLLLEESISK